MDVPGLLREVRDRRGWSQADLAAAAGTSRGRLSSYELATTSPSVTTLERILAAAGMQLRVELEPLRMPLDDRVEAVLPDPGPLSDGALSALARVAEALGGEHPYVVDRGPGEEPERGQAEIGWGFDGETALRLHGWGFGAEPVAVSLAWTPVAQTWFFRQRVHGTGAPPVSWFDASVATAQRCLGELAIGPFGMVRVRLVDRLPQPVRLEVAPGLVVPVLTSEQVERGRPDLAEVLARLREREARSLRA